MICLKDISKKFLGKIALHDATCDFPKNKITVILGPSGSGKTTLVRFINGLDHPDKGEIFYDNEKLTKKNQNKYFRKVGVVFQSFNLFPHMSVIENLIYAPVKLGNIKKDKAEEKALNLLRKLGILEKRDLMPSNLSGGQKQRVAIARTLMIDPEVIIFDEPTSALDPESIKDVVSIIEDLKADDKITTIVVTHHLSFARKIADKIIFMDQGYVLCQQKASEFFKSPDSIRAKMFLESVGEFM
jgi:polar amino acid transport system ATP-binding protein